jgi:transcriptional regulator with XRE-family HTH domain
MQARFDFPCYALRMDAQKITRLRRLRQAAGLSVRELARLIDEQHTNVSYWERTGTLPRSDVLIPIAKVLGVPVEELLGEAKAKKQAAPAGKVRSVFEEVSKLPRRQQDKIIGVVEALLAQSKAA